ncbi:putative Metalloreductase [Taphrina deformans PYCC 5710]|uniref:Metalloreductase n=1 Tax=Taphrina deformans (strain PYCC 5710 / ATCC 11124 / CBS 356.35 / IMI 108563 / JCM 9778 / NBRC 8474) TaxID=1097556 RepID=R4X866_TAPDE|nr:putative Metalloreductase [Taphrina deformans PYCC 5710]|eukprot:CCG81452.1 putative Metalloreductase [Taphrina deformans PYCC 5710]
MLGCGTLVTVTMHMTFFMREWLYYGVWDSQWSEMGAGMLRWGYAAWGLLLIIVVTSINPFRNRWFDHWILIHVFTMLAFFAMTVLHVNASCRLWTISPLVIWAIDSVLRIVSRLRRNTKFGRISTVKYSAILQSLPGEVTRITISNCVIKHHAGQYIYLTVHKLGIHSHAVTIASARDAADLVLFMKAKHGFTRRLLNCSSSALLPYAIGLPCSIEGPYGGSHTPMQAFDTVVLIAGGVGASFTTSLLQDLVNNPGCCRTIRFTWTIKAQSHACWYSDILIQCLRIASTRNIILKIDVHVTSETYPIEDRSSRSRLSVQGKPAEQDNSVCINSVAEIHSISRSPVLVTTDPRTERVKSVLTDIRYYCGRPDFHKLISSTVQSAQGESGIATCGPASMATSIRNHVVDISDARAVKKGTEAEAIYLHVEGQA